jgi:23S rRNA pseudouridine955/2504/2580 synthase
MQDSEKQQVRLVDISSANEGQRIDNYLKLQLKGVPKSLIYRILRKGEVRVNKKRIKPDYKLVSGDIVRIPPVRIENRDTSPVSTKLNSVSSLEQCILHEDNHIIVLNKPSGMAVHGGSGLSFGVIEALRALRPNLTFLELVHRLDRETSGCLLIAKKRSALRHIHQQLREKNMQKKYLALVKGRWNKRNLVVSAPLVRNVLQSGERKVFVSDEGKSAKTRFAVIEQHAHSTLVEAAPTTGRTHQIRVHCLHAGHPIAGDDKYGDKSFNESIHNMGIDRLFLHAHSLQFSHPENDVSASYTAPLEHKLNRSLRRLASE